MVAEFDSLADYEELLEQDGVSVEEAAFMQGWFSAIEELDGDLDDI